MREILFRGKGIGKGRWIIGSLEIGLNTGYEKPIIAEITGGNGNRVRNLERYYVDPDTVGQYIGIRDSFGRKIFEGDFIKGTTLSGDKIMGIIEFNEFTRGFSINEIPVGNIFVADIVGNVYDDPELLKEK